MTAGALLKRIERAIQKNPDCATQRVVVRVWDENVSEWLRVYADDSDWATDDLLPNGAGGADSERRGSFLLIESSVNEQS